MASTATTAAPGSTSATSAPNPAIKALLSALHFAFCLLNFFLYVAQSIATGLIFQTATEKDKELFLVARDKLWNVNKSPIPGFQHYFYRLASGFKFHYISNRAPDTKGSAKNGPLFILIHGFPDSAFMWKHLLQEPAFPLNQSTVVAVDLPGYGGTDGFKVFDTVVLEALTEFILGIRETYLGQSNGSGKGSNVYIVAHDWGAILSLRLAGEAPVLADRFIMVNGPHAQLAYANRDKRLKATVEAWREFTSDPTKNWNSLLIAINAIRPLLYQVFLFGYQYAFQLPAPWVKILGTWGNNSFIRGVGKVKYGKSGQAELDEHEELAISFGPGVNEAKPHKVQIDGGEGTPESKTYGETVPQRAQSEATAWYTMTSFYRDGPGSDDWVKKADTLARLRALDPKTPATTAEAAQTSPGGAGLRGAFHAPVTMLWGEQDIACTQTICLDGIEDYLAPGTNSEITLLPRSGHWSAVEKESRAAFAKLLALYAAGTPPLSVTDAVKQWYPGASLRAKR